MSVSKPEPQVVLTGCAQYRSLVAQYNWNVNTMMAIMRAESGCNPNEISPVDYDGERDYGLLQLHNMDILNPSQNIAAAYHKWTIQGYGAWTSYNTGFYLSYLE